MKYILLGVFITLFFENQIIQFYDKNSVQNSTIGTFIGWFLEEYIKETFNLTGGKFYLTSFDLKNQIILNILAFSFTSYNFVYILTLIEELIHISLFYLIYFNITTQFKISKYLKFFGVCLFVIYFNNKFLNTLFLLMPFIFTFIIFCFFCYIFICYFIIYSYLSKNKYLKVLLIVIKILLSKIFYYLIFSLFLFLLFNFELNFTCNNFMKETFLKTIFLIFN